MIPTINRARCHQCSKAAVAVLARLLTPSFKFMLACLTQQFATFGAQSAVNLVPSASTVLASDGLFENEVRGGGGGLDNQEVVDMCLKSKDSTSAKQLARELVEAAQEVGTTDDVTVAVLRIAV